MGQDRKAGMGKSLCTVLGQHLEYFNQSCDGVRIAKRVDEDRSREKDCGLHYEARKT